MDFRNYQRAAMEGSIHPARDRISTSDYLALGLTGEAGEVGNQIKKHIRDDGEVLTAGRRAKIIEELGDVLWYVAALCEKFEVGMGTVALRNLDKLRRLKGQCEGAAPPNHWAPTDPAPIAPAPEAPHVLPKGNPVPRPWMNKTENDSELLNRLGMDGNAWAHEFGSQFHAYQISEQKGPYNLSIDTLRAWFANAIMAGHDRGMQRAQEAIDKAHEDGIAKARDLYKEEWPFNVGESKAPGVWHVTTKLNVVQLTLDGLTLTRGPWGHWQVRDGEAAPIAKAEPLPYAVSPADIAERVTAAFSKANEPRPSYRVEEHCGGMQRAVTVFNASSASEAASFISFMLDDADEVSTEGPSDAPDVDQASRSDTANPRYQTEG